MRGFKSLCAMLVVTCLCFGFAVTATHADDLLIRGNVNVDDGTKITFSAPLCLLETLKTPIPGPKVLPKEDMAPLVEDLINDFASMKGLDLVNIDVEDAKVRVWVDEVDDDHPEEANFIKVDVEPAGEKDEIHVRIPKGLFFLVSHIGDRFIEMNGETIFQAMQQEMGIPKHAQMHAEKEKESQKGPDFDSDKFAKELQKTIMKEIQKSFANQK